MQFHIIAVGRMRSGPEHDLFESYVRRTGFPVTVTEVAEKKGLKGRARREREAEMLLGGVPAGAVVVLLDQNGDTPDSVTLAKKVGAWRDGGTRELAFLIGGADGHGEAARKRADYTLSLGPMTWPHLLARVMLAEQLYRATTILAGHPYHRC